MIRKTVTTIAAAAVIVTATFTATSAADAASKRDRIIAGVAIGVAAALLGAEVQVGHKNRGHGHNKWNGGGKKQKQGWRSSCRDVPVFHHTKYDAPKLIGYDRVCD